MAVQYSFVMKGLTKTFPGAQKPVFNNIHLQFLPGTKIAVIGVNGAGKSTLMKVIAGIDTEFQGEAWAGEGITVGYLPQEPQLNPKKNVIENVKDGVRAHRRPRRSLQQDQRNHGRSAGGCRFRRARKLAKENVVLLVAAIDAAIQQTLPPRL